MDNSSFCPTCKSNISHFNNEEASVTGITHLGDNTFKLNSPGKLVFVEGEGYWPSSVNTVSLQHGENTLGRKSSDSKSSIQLPTNDQYMSRYQIKIDVMETPDGRYIHHFSHVGDKKNTFLNDKDKDKPLEKGDVFILTPGDTICMGRTILKFSE